MNLSDIIKYEIDQLGPKDQVEALYYLSSWAVGYAEAIEAEEALLDFEAGLLVVEDEDEDNCLVCGEIRPCSAVQKYAADFI